MVSIENNSSKLDKFHGPYTRQNWSLPESIIYYMAKNPSTPEIYQKLIRICKYFFIKNPIIFLPCLHLNAKTIETCSTKGTFKEIDLKTTVYKFWITSDIFASASTTSNMFSTIAPKLHRTTELNFNNCFLTFNEYLGFASTAEDINFRNVTVKYENGKEVEFEKLIELCPNLKCIRFTFSPTSMAISSSTVPKLIKVLQRIPNLKRISLVNLPKIFDLKTFFNKFIKKNNEIKIVFRFDLDSCSNYHNQTMEIVNEILGTNDFSYKCPLFMVFGIDKQTQDALFEKHARS